MIQLVGLLVLKVAGHRQPYWVCGIYLFLLTVVAVGASHLMDNLDHPTEVSHLRSILSERDIWGLALLYLGTFGPWIGFSFAFGLILQINFSAAGQSHAQAALQPQNSPLSGQRWGRWPGSMAQTGRPRRRQPRRPGSFVAMGMATGLMVTVSTLDDRNPVSMTTVGYVGGFMTLFMLSGIGNGAVYKLIPSVFEALSHRVGNGEVDRRRSSEAMSGAVIGFVAAFGALGGVGINLALRQSYVSTCTDTPAYWIFLAF